ncbi:hypothetical protein E1263_05040 [Kribbella antibiotica]|uniref:Uncharacterized protein n=1 Tax=Kribbella antibiotica TaxID=190195 RepID=A0A4V2YQG2_9ACTN|nr:hypothetical protein [Kribbella antibiotica]TDD61987.1 hypothetical protein E1263_05040 [Kribbella antibiotica]
MLIVNTIEYRLVESEYFDVFVVVNENNLKFTVEAREIAVRYVSSPDSVDQPSINVVVHGVERLDNGKLSMGGRSTGVPDLTSMPLEWQARIRRLTDAQTLVTASDD